jgi:hypothetical protein
LRVAGLLLPLAAAALMFCGRWMALLAPSAASAGAFLLLPDPRLSTLTAIAKALGTTLNDLVGEEGPPASPKRGPKRKKGE